MAKIQRYNGNVAAFASQADTNKRTTFGTTDTGDDSLDGNLTADYFTGWQIVGPNDSPTLEDFNAAMFTAGQFLSYLHQAGVPEWNGVQQYQIGSYVNRSGALYVCKTADHVSVTAPESDGVNWGGLDESFVALTGAQSIDGVKTFTESPIVPDATTTTQALARGQVDVANSALVKTALNATGEAPIYACRAWVNFNGTGVVAIRASGNVSSITDTAQGSYTVNLATAMPDANYSTLAMPFEQQGTGGVEICALKAYSVNSVDILVLPSNTIGSYVDSSTVNVSVFR